MIDRRAIAEAAQAVIDAARAYRDCEGGDEHTDSLFALFDALEHYDQIEENTDA